MRRILNLGITVVFVVLACACDRYPHRADWATDEVQIRAALVDSAAGWNRNDLDRYTNIYSKDAEQISKNGSTG